MAEQVKIGFVGAGGIARAHAEALSKIADVKIVGVTDVNPDAAQELAGKAGATVHKDAKSLISECELDAVFILLPPFAHGEGERAALEAGLPFFVEKPVGLDTGFQAEIAAEVARKVIMTSTGYMNRYRNSVKQTRKLLDEEPAIMAYGGWWGGTPGSGGWWPLREKSGGQYHEQVTHTVDLARLFFGEAAEVYAASARGFVKQDGYSMDDALTVAMKFKNGGVVNLMSSCTNNAGGGIFLNVHSMNRNFNFKEWDHRVQIEEKGKDPISIEGEPDIFVIEDSAFVEAVRTKNPSLIQSDYADGAKSSALSLAANQSIETGKPVTLD